MNFTFPIQPMRVWRQAAAAGTSYHLRISDANKAAPPPNATATLEWLAAPTAAEPQPVILQREFLLPDATGWSGLHEAPQRANDMQISLYGWPQLGPVLPRTWEFAARPVPNSRRPRTWKLAVAHQALRYPPTLESNAAICLETIAKAGQEKVDLLCLSECFLSRNVSLPLQQRAIRFDHPLIQALCDAARQAQLYLVFSFRERSPEGPVYNCAPLIGPDGEVIGTYRKNILAQGELEAGITPAGGHYPVFDTPLGKIGILICYDMWYPETAVKLARHGVEIICHPLAGDTLPAHWDYCWRARALDHQVFLLNSTTADCGGQAPSRIIGPDGQVLADTRQPNALATTTVALPSAPKLDWLSGGPYDAVIRNAMAAARTMLDSRNAVNRSQGRQRTWPDHPTRRRAQWALTKS